MGVRTITRPADYPEELTPAETFYVVLPLDDDGDPLQDTPVDMSLDKLS